MAKICNENPLISLAWSISSFVAIFCLFGFETFFPPVYSLLLSFSLRKVAKVIRTFLSHHLLFGLLSSLPRCKDWILNWVRPMGMISCSGSHMLSWATFFRHSPLLFFVKHLNYFQVVSAQQKMYHLDSFRCQYFLIHLLTGTTDMFLDDYKFLFHVQFRCSKVYIRFIHLDFLAHMKIYMKFF